MLDMKQWYQSKAVWVCADCDRGTALKHAGVEMGLAEQADPADALAIVAGALGGMLAIYGRVKATRPIGLGAMQN